MRKSTNGVSIPPGTTVALDGRAFRRGRFEPGVSGLLRIEGSYLVTAIDFRNSDKLYTKKARPTAVTIANCGHTALSPPPR